MHKTLKISPTHPVTFLHQSYVIPHSPNNLSSTSLMSSPHPHPPNPLHSPNDLSSVSVMLSTIAPVVSYVACEPVKRSHISSILSRRCCCVQTTFPAGALESVVSLFALGTLVDLLVLAFVGSNVSAESL